MTGPGDDAQPNVRSNRYIIVESKTVCLQCNLVTKVFTFALPAGYESLYADDDTSDDEEGTWETQGLAGVLSYVSYLPETIVKQIRSIAPHYRLELDIETGTSCWMNHCEHCGAQMMEEALHEDLDGPFGPIPHQGLEAVKLYEVREPFNARAGGESHDLKPLNS